MADCDGLQLQAALESPGLLEIGARAPLRIRVCNTGGDAGDDVRVRVSCSPALLLISTDLALRSAASGTELTFCIAGFLRAESRDIEIDVYALCGGESRIDVRLDCDHLVRETSMTCIADGRAEFSPDANRLELDASEAEAGADITGRLVLTNTGRRSVAVTDIRFEGNLEDAAVDIPAFELGAGERRSLRVRARVPAGAADGAMCSLSAVVNNEVRLADVWIVARSRPRIEATIEPQMVSGERKAVGERIDWQVRVRNSGGARADSVSIALHAAGAVYLPGSSRIDGARIIEQNGSSPLWSTGGLTIEGMASGKTIAVEIATTGESAGAQAMLWARVVCGEQELLVESPGVALAELGAVPRLDFIVRGVTLQSNEQIEEKPRREETVVRRFWRSERAALDAATIRYAEGLGGLMRHLWVEGVLCADEAADARLGAQLGTLRTSLRSVFDRLAIKLRMPHYPVRADDVLDPAAAEALLAISPLCVRAQGLGARLAGAALLIASETADDALINDYRDALAAKLRSFDEDTALIDALVVAQPLLDERLLPVLKRETIALPA